MFRHRRDETQPPTALREARIRFGGLDVAAALAGTLAALGLTVVLGTATAVIEAVRHDQGADRGSLWLAGGITGAAVLVVSLLLGGWVAGRMGRYDGTGNGWLTGFLFVLVLGGATATGNWADDRWGLLKDVQAPGWASSPSRLGEITIALAGIAAVLFVAGLGGAVGARYHRRADALIATHDAAAASSTNVKAVRGETVRGDAHVDLERSDRSAKTAKHAAH